MEFLFIKRVFNHRKEKAKLCYNKFQIISHILSRRYDTSRFSYRIEYAIVYQHSNNSKWYVCPCVILQYFYISAWTCMKTRWVYCDFRSKNLFRRALRKGNESETSRTCRRRFIDRLITYLERKKQKSEIINFILCFFLYIRNTD